MYIYQFNQVPFSIAYINNTNGFLFATFDAVLLLLLTIRASNTEFEQPAWLVKVGVFSPWILCVHAVELTIFPWEKLLEIFPYSPNLTFLIEVLLKIIIIVPCCIVIKIIVQYRFRKLRRNRGK